MNTALKQPRPLTYRDTLVAIALALLAAVALADASRSIIELGYNHEELGYVMLAPMMIAWLLWNRRDQFALCRMRGMWIGILILAAGLFIYWYGYHTDPVLWRAGAVVAVVGAAVTAVGRDALLRFYSAFGACVFLIPISPNGRYRLAVPMQNATARATQSVCDLLGMDIHRAGSTLNINGIDVGIVEACNGMRMIITLFLVCYVVAFTVPLRWWVRVIFLALSPVVAIICNVVRLVPTVYLFGNAKRSTAETFHDVSGWGMSLAAFGVLLLICYGLSRLTTPQPPAAPDLATPSKKLATT
ncbi:MAG TPA: exosortase/archaeosortase family protein [Phycisphaerae bacterium]|jgi:exosortase|nr:exosortase/archaeosortase family protein [Phycisphaerae bacterium]